MDKKLTRLVLLGAILTMGSPLYPQSQDPSFPNASHIEVRVGNGSFDPQHQRPVLYQDDEITLRLKADGEKLNIVLAKGQVEKSSVVLPQEVAQVDVIRRVAKSKAVVIGMVNGDVSEVVVLNLYPLRLIDKFLAYVPGISPDGAFVAFIKFYPPHFVENPTDKYMLYDLRLSASANRPVGVAVSDDVNVGIVVYPTHESNQDADNTGVPESEIHRIASEGFFWTPDSKDYLFADEHAGMTSAVFVSVPKNVGPATCTANIPREELCSHPKTWCGAHLTGVKFKDYGVDAQFYVTSVGAGLTKTITLRCEQFISSH